MATINVSLPNDGDTVDAADYNTPITTIVNEINGNLDNANIDSAAAIAGTKLADSAITTAKINDAAVTSAKLAEAFFRGRYQDPSGNTQPTGLTIQYGWHYVVGDNSGGINKTITFPSAFSSAPVVFVNFLGAKTVASGAPDTTDDFTTWFSDLKGSGTDDITTSDFSAQFNASANFSSTFNFGFSWIAIGPV